MLKMTTEKAKDVRKTLANVSYELHQLIGRLNDKFVALEGRPFGTWALVEKDPDLRRMENAIEQLRQALRPVYDTLDELDEKLKAEWKISPLSAVPLPHIAEANKGRIHGFTLYAYGESTTGQAQYCMVEGELKIRIDRSFADATDFNNAIEDLFEQIMSKIKNWQATGKYGCPVFRLENKMHGKEYVAEE